MDLKDIVHIENDGSNFSIDTKLLKRLAKRTDIAFAPDVEWYHVQMLAIVGKMPGLEQGCYVDRQNGQWVLLAGLASSRIQQYINEKCSNSLRYLVVAETGIEELYFCLKPYLRELWLIDNPKLHYVSGMDNLTGLQKLKIRQEQLDSELDLSKMEQLEELDLRGTEIGEINLDRQLKYLTKCDLTDAVIENLDFLNYCPGLNQLESAEDSLPLPQGDLLPDLGHLVGYMRNVPAAKVDGNDDSFLAAKKIIDSYKCWVEYHRGWEVIQLVDSQKREKAVQHTIHLAATEFLEKSNWDLSPETDSGRGPVDFKISRGSDKTVIEVKLTSNNQCVHGLEVQIEEYAKAEATDKKVFVLVNTGQGENQVEAVKKKREEMLSEGKNPAEVVVIDARLKKAASTHQRLSYNTR